MPCIHRCHMQSVTIPMGFLSLGEVCDRSLLWDRHLQKSRLGLIHLVIADLLFRPFSGISKLLAPIKAALLRYWSGEAGSGDQASDTRTLGHFSSDYLKSTISARSFGYLDRSTHEDIYFRNSEILPPILSALYIDHHMQQSLTSAPR